MIASNHNWPLRGRGTGGQMTTSEPRSKVRPGVRSSRQAHDRDGRLEWSEPSFGVHRRTSSSGGIRRPRDCCPNFGKDPQGRGGRRPPALIQRVADGRWAPVAASVRCPDAGAENSSNSSGHLYHGSPEQVTRSSPCDARAGRFWPTRILEPGEGRAISSSWLRRDNRPPGLPNWLHFVGQLDLHDEVRCLIFFPGSIRRPALSAEPSDWCR